MEFYMILKAIFVLLFLLLILWGALCAYRWGETRYFGKTIFFKPSLFKIDHRLVLDSKHQLVQIRDDHFIYTLLLGERDTVLNKQPIDEKEKIINE